MKALVTGAAGFVGRHMTAELKARGWFVTQWDIADGDDCMDLFRARTFNYDLVVHAAARSPHRAAIDSEPASHIYNQMLDAAMFDWAVQSQQARVLYLSSCAALDESPDAYGQLKLTGERMAAQARAAGVPVTVVRPFSGYGEDQAATFPFRAFMERARRREDPFTIWGDGQQIRDWIHITDVVKAALAVAESGTEQPVSLCTGIGTSMLEVAQMACAQMGYAPEFELRLDKPAGQSVRVGDPLQMLRHYTPEITIEQGIKLAMEADR